MIAAAFAAPFSQITVLGQIVRVLIVIIVRCTRVRPKFCQFLAARCILVVCAALRIRILHFAQSNLWMVLFGGMPVHTRCPTMWGVRSRTAVFAALCSYLICKLSTAALCALSTARIRPWFAQAGGVRGLTRHLCRPGFRTLSAGSLSRVGLV